MAAQAGLAVHSTLLTTALQHTSERLLVARAQERARLQRDLHDELGPALGAISMRAEAARNLLRDGDIARVDAVLATVEHGAEAAGGDADAVPAGLTVHLDLQTPPALPPRVELAAYRVPAEALRNVVRHARATTATISLRFVGGALELRITDDGVGLPNEPRQGSDWAPCALG